MALHELPLEERLHTPGPKRILALDGGGVRGMLTLQYLRRIEDELGARSPSRKRFRLSHYFDLIAGTSTGAIVGACLARGMSVIEITDLYARLAKKVFRRPWWRPPLLTPKFDADALGRLLDDQFGDGKLDDVQTGLLIMAKRFDSTSPWPIHNNPRGQDPRRGSGLPSVRTLDFGLSPAVRASTGAPYDFRPKWLEVAREGPGSEARTVEGRFVDGGMSVMNNPALQALMVATLDGFRLRWPTGRDRILLVSVGTGRSDPRRKPARFPVKHALQSVTSVLDDCAAHVETMMQLLSHSPTARPIDGEIGTLDGERFVGEPLATYVRYDVELSPSWLDENLPPDPQRPYDDAYVKRMAQMDRAKNIPDLARLGATAAEVKVPTGDAFHVHFPRSFEPWSRHGAAAGRSGREGDAA